VIEPMPPEPPPTKPPIVAMRLVEGCMRISQPFGRVAASRSCILMPGSQRTMPGRCHSIFVMLERSSNTPPSSGTAWP
jgi:hypothetical protein